MADFTPEKIVKGGRLMLFIDSKSVAYATSHTLSVSAETTDTSSKDHGKWGATEVNRCTWEITSENIYTHKSYDALYDKMIAGEKVTVIWGEKAEDDSAGTVADGDFANWTPAAAGYYTGSVLITSLQANANNGENATFSVTLTGVGKFERVSTSPSAS